MGRRKSATCADIVRVAVCDVRTAGGGRTGLKLCGRDSMQEEGLQACWGAIGPPSGSNALSSTSPLQALTHNGKLVASGCDILMFTPSAHTLGNATNTDRNLQISACSQATRGSSVVPKPVFAGQSSGMPDRLVEHAAATAEVLITHGCKSEGRLSREAAPFHDCPATRFQALTFAT
jgi:hypothetical protein